MNEKWGKYVPSSATEISGKSTEGHNFQSEIVQLKTAFYCKQNIKHLRSKQTHF